MRSPRLKFTVRRLMIAVAGVALALTFLIPAGKRNVVWLYNHAFGCGTPMLIHYVPSNAPTRLNTAKPTYLIGQPVPFEANCPSTRALDPCQACPIGSLSRSSSPIRRSLPSITPTVRLITALRVLVRRTECAVHSSATYARKYRARTPFAMNST